MQDILVSTKADKLGKIAPPEEVLFELKLIIADIAINCQILPYIAKYRYIWPDIAIHSQILPDIARYCHT